MGLDDGLASSGAGKPDPDIDVAVEDVDSDPRMKKEPGGTIGEDD